MKCITHISLKGKIFLTVKEKFERQIEVKINSN